MFTNLIESSSHAREYKRRGSFLLFTGVIYLVLFVVTGVVGIYAYDARLEKQTLEFVTMLSPQEIVPEREIAPVTHPDGPRNAGNKDTAIPERTGAMLDVDRPEVVPEKVSAAPNKILPLPPHGQYKISDHDLNPGPGGDPRSSSGGGRQMVQPTQIVTLPDKPPDPEPPQRPKPPKVVSKGPITGEAVSLPKPVYSELAKRMRIQGKVSVQVLVDLDGRVISATVLSGSPFLRAEAQKAALQARFSPTMLGDQPVRVSGVIIYNFELGK
jgi:TonB family protein